MSPIVLTLKLQYQRIQPKKKSERLFDKKIVIKT